MTLTSHAIVGAAAASFFPKNPVLAFSFGFLSHYLLDAFPHGHYPTPSHTQHPENRMLDDMVYGKDFFTDILKIGFDFCAGLILAFLFFKTGAAAANWTILLGALAGTLPDALSFIYWKTRTQPFITLQRFHTLNHAQKEFGWRTPRAIFAEAVSIALAILLARTLGG